jgi:hypothetical protein
MGQLKMISSKNFSVHDDLTGRLAFFTINIIQILLQKVYLSDAMVEPVRFVIAIALLITMLAFPPTPFTKDIKEFLIFDAIFNFSLGIIYALPNNWYNNMFDYGTCYLRIINTLFLVRLVWPYRDTNGDFVGWPTFGLLGLIAKWRGASDDLPKLSPHQYRHGYCAIVIASLLGYGFYYFEVKNTTITSFAVLIIFIVFALKKSLTAHQAKIAAQKAAEELAQQKLAEERAAAECLRQFQMQFSLDAQLAAQTNLAAAKIKAEELDRERAEKEMYLAKIAQLQALHTPEADYMLNLLLSLPDGPREAQMRVIEALHSETIYFPANQDLGFPPIAPTEPPMPTEPPLPTEPTPSAKLPKNEE